LLQFIVIVGGAAATAAAAAAAAAAVLMPLSQLQFFLHILYGKMFFSLDFSCRRGSLFLAE